MSSILGHNRQREYINKLRANSRFAHAYVFSGPEHVGKLTIAKTLAKSFFCESAKGRNKKFEDICGVCSTCIAIEENKNNSVFFLDAEHTLTSKKDTRKDIPIEDIRELKRQFSLRSSAGWRVVIINEAEHLSEQAANAFLKLLEEPGENSLFILVTAHEELMLPTITSRAQHMHFGLVSDHEIKTYIEKQGCLKAEEDAMVQLAQGRPGILFSMLVDRNFFDTAQKRMKFIARLLRASIPDIFRTADKIAVDENARNEAMHYLFLFLRNSLISPEAGPKAGALISLIKKLDRVQFLMENTNVNPRLALETLFLEARKAYTT